MAREDRGGEGKKTVKQVLKARWLILAAGLVLAGCQTETLPGDNASTTAHTPKATEIRATTLRR
jgi:hypothetical protein